MMWWVVATVPLAAAVLWFRARRVLDVPCEVDLEATHDSMHAHVSLEGVEPEPGDEVLVRGTPSEIPFGEVRRFRSSATVAQASWPRRAWTRLRSRLDITELYEVGFE
ncbi:MAG: hypothetical protein SFU84_01900 [Gemmatimonadales bacterium]|nr:hypothetical protein [Gemmatimonadales bacterium]